jgi:hypothetical protein
MLREDEKKWLVQLLKDYIDVFAWSFHDMPGLDPEVACHKLNLDPSFSRRGERYLPQWQKQ